MKITKVISYHIKFHISRVSLNDNKLSLFEASLVRSCIINSYENNKNKPRKQKITSTRLFWRAS